MRAAWLVSVLVACGGGQSEPAKPVANVVARSPADAAVDAAPNGLAVVFVKMTEFTDRMCACKDKACAEALSDEMSRWGTEIAKQPHMDEKVSDADAKRMADITDRFSKCMTALYTSGGSATP